MRQMGQYGFGQGGPGQFVRPTNYNPQELSDQFFVYDFAFGNLAAGQTVTQSLPTQADANFLWEMTTFYGTENGAVEPVSDQSQFPFLIQLTDSGTGRSFFANSSGAAAVPVGNVCGTGKFPTVLPQPYLIKAVSTMQAILMSLSANVWNNCHLSLVGKKTYFSIPIVGPAIG